jgi:hypothetical protein
MTLSFYRLIWLLPIAFVLHLIEEYCTGYAAYAGAVTGYPMALPMFLGPNLLFVAIMALLTVWAAKAKSPAAIFWMLAWAAGNLFWNFVYHLIAVPAHDRHSPGLITGALVYLPLSLAVWQAALAEKVIGCKPLAAAIALGGVFMALVAAVGIYHVGGIGT